MLNPLVFEGLEEGLRIYIFGALPLVAAVSLIAIIWAIFQATMSFQETASAYAVRFLTSCAVLYLTVPALARFLVELLQRSLS